MTINSDCPVEARICVSLPLLDKLVTKRNAGPPTCLHYYVLSHFIVLIVGLLLN